MTVRADLHMHSSFSGDSDTPMDEMIRAGLSRGLTHICFTEHMDLDYPVSSETPPGFFELDGDAYRRAFLGCRENWGEHIGLLFGVELGLQPHLAQANARFARSYEFDMIIGSSHVCHGKDPYYPSFFEGRSQEEAYREYFASILENIRVFSEFDVYGHLDYVVRYGPRREQGYSYAAYRELFDAILTMLIQKGKGIELNTGGLSGGLREPHPCLEVLRRYRELGGEILTVGSDAHTPDRVGGFFDRAREILEACGFRYYTVFEKRKPVFIPL